MGPSGRSRGPSAIGVPGYASVDDRRSRAHLVKMVFWSLVACLSTDRDLDPSDSSANAGRLDLPADAALGERLFRDTRFSWFYAQTAIDLNAALSTGDPALAAPLVDGVENPYAGGSFACRSCHLLDEGDAQRAYADYAARSPVTDRGDGAILTPRNTPALIESAAARDVPFLLHWDGEFVSGVDLGRHAYTGRNMGWLADDGARAQEHLAAVLRADDGSFGLASAYGGLSYAAQFGGAGDLPVSAPLDLGRATDDEVLDAVAAYTAAYLEALVYLRGDDGSFSGSAYDRFLAANGLPNAPSAGESPRDYGRRLRGLLAAPVLVDGFAADALAGLRIFLAEPETIPPSGVEVALGGIGNCASCHPPPAFTDYALHNTVVAEASYDRVHDVDAFLYFMVPTLAERDADPAAFLPPSSGLPDGSGLLRSFPEVADPRRVDLGAWNILFNPEFPEAQAGLRALVQDAYGLAEPSDEALLSRSVGLFKTPTLRGLALSGPYFHDGSMPDLEAVLRFYRGWTPVARDGFTVNADPQFLGVLLEEADVAALQAFLTALDEPYPSG